MADAKRRRVAPKTFSFAVKGQTGEIPQLGLGTATLNGEVLISAVKAAIRAGYRHIDTALLYDNQEAVGEALKQLFAAGEVKREDIWVTSKVSFYPPKADGENLWCPIAFLESNKHGYENVKAAADLCLKKLQLDYVDLFLVHNPATEVDEYMASGLVHKFELGQSGFPGQAKLEFVLPEERDLLMQYRLKKANAVYDEAKAEAIRADSWRGFEELLQQKKCRFIGVSNYPPRLMQAMEKYAKVFPCVNQLELHPRFSSPTLQRYCKDKGVVLTAYGSGNSARIEMGSKQGAVAAELAKKYGVCPTRIHLRWTLQRGIVVIPRTAHEGKIAANLAAASGDAFELTAEEMGRLDALNQGHAYYWSPLPCQPPGTKPDA